MPGHYNMPVIPNRYPLDKNDKLGLAIGALLSGGLAAANSNRNMGENPLLRGVAGGVAGFGGGANQIQDSYSKMLDDYLKGEGMDFRNRELTQEQQQFQDTLGLNREKLGRESKSEFNTPGDLDTFLASKAGRFGLDYSNQTDRMKMLKLFGNQSTGLSRQYNQWKPSLAPSIYNVIPGYQTPEGQPKTYNMRTGIPSREKPLQKTPSEADVKFERDYTTADALLDELEASFEANKNSLPQDSNERITEYPSRLVGKALQTEAGVGLKNLESLRIAIMPKMIRALGEVGTLTDADIARVNQAIPSTNDVESVRKKGFQQIRDLIKEVHSRGQRQQNVIPGSSIDKRPPLSAFESK